MSGVTAGFRSLLGRLRTYKVNWEAVADDENYDPLDDRDEAGLAEANVVSSQIKPPKPSDPPPLGSWYELFGEEPPARHVVALDIDYPAYLIPSTTADHFHLYLDVPGGVGHDDYMELLALLGRIGIIEEGYAQVSQARGHTALRLPWVQKDDQRAATSEEMRAELPQVDDFTGVEPF